MTNSTPSVDPANFDSLLGTFRVALRKHLQDTDNKLPAKVVSYDRPSNRVQVQPLIQVVTTEGELVTRAQIASLPVVQFGGGGVVLSFNLQPGNLGWIKACDRDISLFKQLYANQPPNTDRFHSFSDASFWPDVMTGYTVAAEDAGNTVLQTLDGSVCLAIWPTQIKMTMPNACVTDTKAYAPRTSAVLDVQSTTKAFKIPRMSQGQRDAIPSPEGGYMVYVTDTSPPKFSFYTDGFGWS